MKAAFFSVLLFVSGASFSQGPSVQLRVDVSPQEGYIGDVFAYTLTVTYSSSIAPAPLTLPDPFGDMVLLDLKSKQPEPLPDGKLTVQHRVFLTTFSTGAVTIPAVTLKFLVNAKKEAEATTEEVPIKIRSLLEEKGDLGNIRPLKGLFNFKSYFWLWVLLGVLLAAGLIWFVVRAYKEKQKNKFPEGPPKPPEEVAWDRLHDLENGDFLEEGRIREFYFELSTILREYLENRHSISALDRTTAELNLELRKLNLDGTLMSLLRQYFDNSDLVKFAKFTPAEEEVEGDIDRIKQYISLTTPKKKESSKKEMEKIPI